MSSLPYLTNGISVIAQSLVDDIVFEAAQALRETAGLQSETESPAPSVRKVFKKAFSRSYREDRNRLAVAVKLSENRTAFHHFFIAKRAYSAELSKELNKYLSNVLKSTAELSTRPISPKLVTDQEAQKSLIPKISGERLTSGSIPFTPPATLSIVNERILCIEETNELGQDHISVSILLVDPIGAVHPFGPWDCGHFSTGDAKLEKWYFAGLNLGGPAESIKWPRTYTVVFTIAEKDQGGFGDFIAELIGKIQNVVHDKMTELITSLIMAKVGAAIAVELATVLGISGNFLVPGLGALVGFLVGWVLGMVIGEVFHWIEDWVKDDIFIPLTNSLTLYNPGELWNGKGISDPWGFWWRGHGGQYELQYRWMVDWSTSLGQSSSSTQSLSPSNPGVVQSITYLGNDGSISCLWAGNEWANNLLNEPSWQGRALSDPFVYIVNKDGLDYQVTVFQDEYFQISRRLLKIPSDSYIYRDIPTQFNEAMLVAGRPKGYTYKNVECIAYRGFDSHIHVVWEEQRIRLFSIWTQDSPSKNAQAPYAAGDPCCLVSDNGDIQNIYYRGNDQRVYRLWAGQQWKKVDVTATAQTPLAAGEPYAYLLHNTIQVVCFRGVDGQIWVCWWDGSAWGKRSPSIDCNAPAAAGDPSAVISPDGVFQHIVYRGIDGNIFQLWADEEWKLSTPTQEAGTSISAGNPSAYFYDKTFCIAYLGIDGAYYVIWWTGSKWDWKNITLIAGSAKPAA